MIEIIFIRYDVPEWEFRSLSHHVPGLATLVKIPDANGDLARGTIYKVDDVIWMVPIDAPICLVEVRLIDI